MRTLVTGGAGYIGSQTCLELLRAGHEICVVDNLYNSSEQAIERVRRLCNRELDFRISDIRDTEALDRAFAEFRPEAVVHFAGLKSVVESISQPERYYDINIGGTTSLLGIMSKHHCNNIVFSSSATVYGEPQYLPCDELHTLNPINPYGRTKQMTEQLLSDWTNTGENRVALALRYFNPVGADVSGLIGEAPNGIPNNLMPIIAQVATGKLSYLNVFGQDYDTRDGTAVRDYVHVVDLALAHVVALEKLEHFSGFEPINIGTGNGISVLEMIEEFEKISNRKINFQFVQRRIGDAPEVWAEVSKAKNILGFTVERGLSEMCRDTWRWQCKNPEGYNHS